MERSFDVRFRFDRRCVGDRQGHMVRGINSHVPFGSAIQNLFVFGPKAVPNQIDDSFGGALAVDVRLEGGNLYSTTHDSTNGRHSSVVPPGNQSLFNEPRQLAFTQYSVLKINLGKGMDLYTTQSQSRLDPLILFVAILVLRGTHGVSNTFNGIDNGTCQIVGRIRLEFDSRPMVGRQVLSIQHWISKRPIIAFHVDLGPQTPFFSIGFSFAHIQKQLLRFLVCLGVTILGFNACRPFLLHLFLWGIIHKGVSVRNKFQSHLLNDSKIVARVRNNVGMHI
mmetsp:Transcript_19541/g.31444  ORF Transcript_19541/g.31444 Transcript_19541/m.31444 type:complete len:280 (-) Transcript_19541:676-1515(-)